MRRVLLIVAPGMFWWIAACCAVQAQGTAQSDEIKNGNQETIQDKESSNGKFPPVTVNASVTSDVRLQFPSSAAGKTVLVLAVDGGSVSLEGYSAVLDENALLTFSFTAGDQPGIYRVLAMDPTAEQALAQLIGVVQFEVPNPPE